MTTRAPSSQDLHPRGGARFVFERVDDSTWRVCAYLPGTLCWQGELSLGSETTLTIDSPAAPVPAAPWTEHWTVAEAHKLARILRRQPKPKLVRWRPPPDQIE